MQNILKVNNLTKIYDTGRGIRNVSFELQPGTILGVIGLNGAGKSTLISCLTGFLKWDSGNIEYNFSGTTHNKIKPTLLNDLGIVSSDYGFPGHFTAKIISRIMSYTYKNWDAAKFIQTLDHLELDYNLKTSKYSTGMKTKLAIAIALSHNAKILVLDEATRGLDVKASSKVRALLHAFVESGENAIILTSHIMGEIERLSDEIILIEDGDVQLNSNKDDLLHQHQIFTITSKQLDSIERSDIAKIRKEDHAIYIIAKNPKDFYEKYNIESIHSTLERVIELLLEGEAA
ncbi:MAG: ABC transporter ATP-binding protein [Defluviitaleaceae bacterium]|nr:ABC transporter ATP-binding protein [Defluviitaleaceae bacterium]